MARLTTADRILLWTLLPLFAVAFALHLKEVARTGIAQPPFFASPPEVAGGYPTVGGPRLERGASDHGLRVGDRLISVGGEDLAGQGYFGFEAIALEKAGTARAARLVYERDGERHTTVLRMQPYQIPWFRIPFLLSSVAMAVLVLLRSPGTRSARLFFAAWVSFSILETPFIGGPRVQTWAYSLLFNFGGAVAIVLLLRWLIQFPPETPEDRRAPAGWAWLGLLHVVVRLNYILGGPLSSELVPAAALVTDATFGAAALGIVTWNTLHASPIGRRRVKWALLGAYIGVSPMIVTTLAQAVAGGWAPPFHVMFQWSALAAVAVPAGILIAIARYNLFDIDRLLSATASTSLLAVGFLGVLAGLLPGLGSALEDWTGVPAGAIRLALALGAAAALVPLYRRLSPRLDGLLFPERVALRSGVSAIRADLGRCSAPPEVMTLLADRLYALVRPEAAAACLRREADFAPLVVHGAALLPRVAPRSELALRLAQRAEPLDLVESPEPDEDARRLLAAGFSLLLPVRSGNALAGFLALGAKRSGDIYTREERSLLGALAERASGQLARLRDAEALRAERSRAEDLRALKERAEDANLARSRFLAAASHDLRQPLHALRMQVQILEERLGGHPEADRVDRIQRSAASLSEMLSSLLDVSRLDVGAVEAQPAAVALSPLLDDLAAELRPAAAARGLSLAVTTAPVVVRTDPLLLGRILRNLAVNAIRYTDEGEVGLHCRVQEGRVLVEVTDTGPGIPEGRQHEVFGEFVRLEHGRDRGGLGLGLSIVQRLSALLDHPVSVHSEGGRGSTFRVGLGEARPHDEARAPRERFASSLAGRVVVAVDDDLEVLAGLRDLLEAWGCRAIVAASAADARQGVERAGLRPDAIVADYALAGGRTGLDAIKELRAVCGAEVPAVVVTGETSAAILARIEAAGLPVLTKPTAPARLRALLQELVRGGAPLSPRP